MKSYLTCVGDKKIRNGYITWETRLLCDNTKSEMCIATIFKVNGQYLLYVFICIYS